MTLKLVSGTCQALPDYVPTVYCGFTATDFIKSDASCSFSMQIDSAVSSSFMAANQQPLVIPAVASVVAGGSNAATQHGVSASVPITLTVLWSSTTPGYYIVTGSCTIPGGLFTRYNEYIVRGLPHGILISFHSPILNEIWKTQTGAGPTRKSWLSYTPALLDLLGNPST